MTRTLHLSDGALALALALPQEGMPEILAFGADATGVRWAGERATRDSGMDADVPSATLLPVHGMGSFGWPGLSGHRDGAASVLAFGNWRFEGDQGSGRLSGRDEVAQIDLAFDLSISDGALSVRTILTNTGDGVFTLDRCMAGAMIFPEGPAELTSFTGMWGREFQTGREPLLASLWLQENRRGRTSHDRFPGVILSSPAGSLAAHLGWSGNHVVAIERLDDGRRLVHLGELFGPGEMRLGPGEAYSSPLAFFAPDAEGLRSRLKALMTWPGGAITPRPVMLNTWEGTYFAHHLPTLMEQADAAAALGIERFVLDDGWFGRRNSDATSLGDWTIDQTKYPDGLKPLADHVHGLGMQFGLWVEPEMVNPDSDLYRAHPDWVLGVQGRAALRSRKQLVLDLARQEVADHVFHALDLVLNATPIDYLKWDMNRDLAPGADAMGRTLVSAQTRAAYALMDRIRAAHPYLEIESCASGGARADYGVLARTHRIWTSDGTDALARLEIQRGARLFFPPEILGAHVSASPNHQTHRSASLDFRALVAFAYHFGIELDPTKLTDEERACLQGWIALHKRLRPVTHEGRQFHLEPIDGRYAWGASDNQTIVLVMAQGPQMMGEQPPPLRLPAGLAGGGEWRIATCTPATPDFVRVSAAQRKFLGGETAVSAAMLTASGLPLPMLRPQSGCVLEITRIEGDGE
jgi:alpha-galactosidase